MISSVFSYAMHPQAAHWEGSLTFVCLGCSKSASTACKQAFPACSMIWIRCSEVTGRPCMPTGCMGLHALTGGSTAPCVTLQLVLVK